MQVGTYPTRNFAQFVTTRGCYLHAETRSSRFQRNGNTSQKGKCTQRGGLDISANLCMSPCSSDCLFIQSRLDAWRTVSEDPTHRPRAYFGFLLIICTERIFTAIQLNHEYRRILRLSSIQPRTKCRLLDKWADNLP